MSAPDEPRFACALPPALLSVEPAQATIDADGEGRALVEQCRDQAIRLLLDNLEDPQAQSAPLNAIGHRHDQLFLRRLLDRLGDVPTEVVKGNLRRIESFVWLREALDWPLAAASVALKLGAGKKVTSARVAMGHVAPVPWNAGAAAEFLSGKTINEDVAAEAGKIAVADANALSRNGYKIQLAQVAVKRAILQAAG